MYERDTAPGVVPAQSMKDGDKARKERIKRYLIQQVDLNRGIFPPPGAVVLTQEDLVALQELTGIDPRNSLRPLFIKCY